jgi:hypothetical protein|tara:strand:- start:1198 stop:1929 length:732 start_codon:yes stop_codon:yes gene_type:complete
MKHKIIGLSLLCMFSFNAIAQATDDNEINIDQTGDTLTLFIDQYGYGNKIGLDDFSSTSSPMSVTGSSLNINIDQIGNENLLFGTIAADSSTYNLLFTGDSNSWDWNIGYIGSADSSTIDVDITGDSNTMDFDQGYNASAERLDLDLNVLGSTNIFDVDIDVDDAIWNFDITGASNNINTMQKDGGEQEINLTLSGDSADIDINQMSGTCATGVTTCNGIITLDVTSSNATIQINQKDSSGDS